MGNLIIDCFAGGGGASVGICPYIKIGERVPNLVIDDSDVQLKFA